VRAWILDDSPGGYRFGAIDDPMVGPGDVRIRPVASALNHMDLWLTRGMPRPPLPHVPGCDVAGTVDAVGEGVGHVVPGDEVVESVGPATWDRSMKALRPGGRLVVCGGTSGQTVELSLPRLFFKQIQIIGSTMGSYPEFADVTRLVAQGLPVTVDEAFDLEDYPTALERLRQGAQLGKVVLRHPVASPTPH
jgi:NADPH:quinone reductase-like Zn-dependent oxidoreductase